MTSLPVLVLVLGIGIVRYQSIGHWVLGVQLGIVLTLANTIQLNTNSAFCPLFSAEENTNRIFDTDLIANPSIVCLSSHALQ